MQITVHDMTIMLIERPSLTPPIQPESTEIHLVDVSELVFSEPLSESFSEPFTSPHFSHVDGLANFICKDGIFTYIRCNWHLEKQAVAKFYEISNVSKSSQMLWIYTIVDSNPTPILEQDEEILRNQSASPPPAFDQQPSLQPELDNNGDGSAMSGQEDATDRWSQTDIAQEDAVRTRAKVYDLKAKHHALKAKMYNMRAVWERRGET